jgi:hypothetical protein
VGSSDHIRLFIIFGPRQHCTRTKRGPASLHWLSCVMNMTVALPRLHKAEVCISPTARGMREYLPEGGKLSVWRSARCDCMAQDHILSIWLSQPPDGLSAGLNLCYDEDESLEWKQDDRTDLSDRIIPCPSPPLGCCTPSQLDAASLCNVCLRPGPGWKRHGKAEMKDSPMISRWGVANQSSGRWYSGVCNEHENKSSVRTGGMVVCFCHAR